ncbi:MAG: endonuclease III [Chloroflexi bacterium]|nr:endonuclease III [Chloroflexota bacterium]
MSEDPAEHAAQREKVRRIIELLKKQHGAPPSRPGNDPVSVLVQTILSQNTTDINSGEAFLQLRADFPAWEDVAGADIEAIAGSIRRGGLGVIKAGRIRQALHEIARQRGRIELDFLKGLPPEAAEQWLVKLPGVGLKTARCVLLFSLEMPALPVDTHILRVSRRLGLLRPGASPDEAHRVLSGLVPPEDVYAFHMLTIEHGRNICQARRPRCQECLLRELCAACAPIPARQPAPLSASPRTR